MKSDLVYLKQFSSLEHFLKELVEYVDYNNFRIKKRLNGMSLVK
ncbi:IS3 family transposase [Labilibaculum filiforme]